ncbi:endonuclease domain-containing protein [Variibacter gotjawalensis]|nr:endonuclease domain-containing protein [Variibacter gotjawalensis]NIK50131.1 very-short-patch-repair endonuclease [Variibacter gotjawalensis]
MTRAEVLLWRYLKAHHVDGFGFRRQAPLGPFIVDFVCHEARLAIELDGETHDFAEQQRRDLMRDRWLRSRGYSILRFSNDDVLKNLEGVIASIRAIIAHGTPPSLSLPRKGGGNPNSSASGAEQQL